MRIDLIGTGDAFGSGGRFNSCLRLRAGEADMLVDCGASSLVALNLAGVDRNELRAILFTHFHGDHLHGLPFFVLDAQFVTKRAAQLLIAGPKGIEARALAAMESAFPGSSTARRAFKMRFIEVTPEAPAVIDGVGVTAFPVVHDDKAGPCQGYRLEHGGKVFAMSGDTGWTDTLIPLADGADALLVECYSHDRKLPNHLDWETLGAHLPEITARRIILTHMGPQMLAFTGSLEAQGRSIARAFDGMRIEL
jgi:ribonuclease BN (tRNA processing enzyme)